jgi:hypothetical protein
LVWHRLRNGRTSQEECGVNCPGHSFIIFLDEGFFPLNVLNSLKMVPEVCRIFCATANPTEVILAETEQGRGIMGVVDGFPPEGIEDEAEIKWRKDLLRQIGYKQ